MKRIANLMSLSALFNEADEGGGGGGGEAGKPPAQEPGLMASLDTFMEKNPEAKPSASSPDNPPPAGSDQTPPAGKTEEPPAAGGENKPPEDKVEDDDLGLPQIGKIDPASGEKKDETPPAFDENAFDAETDKILKGIEEKGHPGEVYKDLRAELKALKSQDAVSPQLQAKLDEMSAENERLKGDAERVKAMEDRVTSITTRNAELLLEENPDYKAKVTDPHKEITTTVSALAKARGLDEAEIWTAMQTKDPTERIKAFDELEKKIGSRYAISVEQMADQMRVIARTDADMRENAVSIVEDAKKAANAASGEESAARSKAFKEAATASFTSYAEKIPGFVDSTGNPTDAARAASARADVVDVNSLTEGDLGYMVFSVQALPQALSHVKALEKENQDLRVAAGTKAKDVIPVGGEKKPAGGDDHLDADGKPRGFLDGFLDKKFESGV